MKRLGEIDRSPGLDHSARCHTRAAVRAIILRQAESGPQVLLIYSTVNGDYKFPGGGVEPGETPAVALAREVQEECGARLAAVEAEFGEMVEYDTGYERGYDLFCMTSSYYLCQITGELGCLQLDAYEARLAFHPVWTGLDKAIAVNQARLERGGPDLPRWTQRDTYVLVRLREWLATAHR